MGIAKLECATCHSSLFMPSGLAYSNGMIAMECCECHAFCKVMPPVRLLQEDGTEQIVSFDPSEVIKKVKLEDDTGSDTVTVVLKIPKAVRDRFREAIKLAKKVSDCEERGMYPTTVFEYMIEEFIQSHQHEAEDAG